MRGYYRLNDTKSETKHNNLKRCMNFGSSFGDMIEDILGTTGEI